MRAIGIDAARQLESCGIELEYREVAKLVAIGVEKLVVVNIGVLAEDPLAVRIQIGLRRLALNLVAQRVLPLVRVGKIKLVEEK